MGKVVLTPQQEQEIIYNYTILKQSQRNAGKNIGVSYKVVQRILKEHNIYIRTPGESRRHFDINHNYFKIQTPDMAYWLGILSSDGCIASNKNLIYIELQRTDKELLEKLNNSINNEREIKDYYNNSRNYENSKLYFYSQEIKGDLATYHIIPNKTYNKDFIFPEKLQEEFYPDYIRGLFDGDGSIKDANHTPCWQIDSSSLDIIQHLYDYLNKLNIAVKIIECPKVNCIIYRLYCYGQVNLYKIYNLLYNTPSNLFLKRKKDKIISFLK